jgi:hypothetical protein
MPGTPKRRMNIPCDSRSPLVLLKNRQYDGTGPKRQPVAPCQRIFGMHRPGGAAADHARTTRRRHLPALPTVRVGA